MKLQSLAYTTATATPDPSHIYDLHHSSRQRWILNPLSEARDQSLVLMILVGFITAEPQWGLQTSNFFTVFSRRRKNASPLPIPTSPPDVLLPVSSWPLIGTFLAFITSNSISYFWREDCRLSPQFSPTSPFPLSHRPPDTC